MRLSCTVLAAVMLLAARPAVACFVPVSPEQEVARITNRPFDAVVMVKVLDSEEVSEGSWRAVAEHQRTLHGESDFRTIEFSGQDVIGCNRLFAQPVRGERGQLYLNRRDGRWMVEFYFPLSFLRPEPLVIEGLVPTPRRPDKPSPVIGNELSAALTGKTLRRADANIGSPDQTEVFEPNGGWIAWGMRVPKSGTYRVERDHFCVERQGLEPSCRVLLRDSSGSHFVHDWPSRPDKAALQEVHIR
jgi:hypothetical protein